MLYYLELTTKDASILVKLLATKAKEIHAWRIATKSQTRDKEYDDVATLLKKIHTQKGG